jgi:DNA-binding CsgD family transcriptional regulator
MLFGRSAETATIDRLIAAMEDGRSGVLVVRGEAGVGKSALLEYAAENANGFTLLHGAGVDGESELAYAALHQILRPVFDRIEQLPEPQAAALRAAFALSTETVDERFRVSLGVLGLLSEVAEERPLLCLVDDAQWLDQASADALLFAARRLEAEPVVLLFAAREGDERPFASRGLPEVRLAPLSQADSRTLLAERLGTAVATGVFDWLVENANGNPLALVELPATLSAHELAGQDPLAGRLPPATSVEHVYLERIAGLPPPVRTLLVLAAAEETGVRVTIERAADELGLDIGDLAAAESAGLLRIDSEQLVFHHPLVRTAIYRSAPFIERERAHRTLAIASKTEGSVDRAAWHRAAATVGPSEEVALELESTAERARLRSGHAAAAAALDRAAELSADAESRARRLVAAASAAWHAGQPERATTLLDRATPIVSDSSLRAELDHLRGVIEWRCGSILDARATLMAGAVRIAPLDPRRALRMLFDAGMAAMDSGDYSRVAEVGHAAAALPRPDDEESTFLADMLVGVGQLSEGRTPQEVPLVREAIARARDFEEPLLLIFAAIWAPRVGESGLSGAILKRAGNLARASGAVDALTFVLEGVAVQGFLAGQYSVAGEATEGLRLAREAGLTNAAIHHMASLAWLAAVKGQDDECRTYAAEVTDVARMTGHGLANSIAEWGVALLDLSIGQPEATVKRLLSLSTAPPGVGHPYFVLNSVPDLVEACVRAGTPALAKDAHSAFQAFAQPGAPTWALALAARCRALLAEGEAAGVEFEEGIRLHSEGTRPFDRARTELLFGEHLRRQRRRRESREYLRSAFESFESLGAPHWAERAHAELRASGETARKRDPSTLGQLTPQELQIARLVGEGSSNKEVAAQLFLSPRTVDYHLRKVFMKLGISSRAELIRDGVAAEADPEKTPALS